MRHEDMMEEHLEREEAKLIQKEIADLKAENKQLKEQNALVMRRFTATLAEIDNLKRAWARLRKFTEYGGFAEEDL